MRVPVLILTLALAGCGDAGDPAGNSAPSNPGGFMEPTTSNVGDVAPPGPVLNVTGPEAALPGIDAPPNPARSHPVATPSPEPQRDAAARVVRIYYARIAKREFAAARAMWDDNGDASGLTEADFAKRFDRFSEFRAEVGTPERIDGGEGQRYVDVPIRLFGRMKDDGATFEKRGIVTLHRTGDIEGANASQRQWRVAGAETMPEPGQAPIVTAHYQCNDGERIVARFDNNASTVTLRRGYQRVEPLPQQTSGSGIWYKSADAELRGKGKTATITLPGQAPLECRER